MGDDNKLSREALYNAADIQDRDFPIERIKAVDVTAHHYTDVSILVEANIELARFRVCNLAVIPPQIFELEKLRVLDLAGNALHNLPDAEVWARMANLRYLSLNDNNITDLSEILKAASAPNLKQLMAAGNICLSEEGAFQKIVRAFPSLCLLNDRIVTSQFRGSLEDVAVNDPNALVPSAKVDDYVLLYVGYQKCPIEERNIRNANVQLFCLNRAIRKYSAVDKIQSVWRGYRVRQEYKKRMRAGLFLHDYISYWCYMRKTGAERRRQRQRAKQMAEQGEEFHAAVRIQSFWRKKMSDDVAIIDVFETSEGFSFCLKPEHAQIVKNFISETDLQQPDEISDTGYEIIRENTPKTVNLPGSPMIHYQVDGSAMFRVKRCHETRSKHSIWCGHDHSKSCDQARLKVNKTGVNFTKVCAFQRVRVIPSYYRPKTQVKLPVYKTMVRCVYRDREQFAETLWALIESKLEIRLFPARVVESSAAQTIVQASLRAFSVRSKSFREMKGRAIEDRSINVIRFCLKTIKIYKMVKHILKVNQYHLSLERSNAFYVPQILFQQIQSRECQFPVKFGYSSEREVVLDASEKGYLTTVVPTDEIVFAVSGLDGLLKVGATMAKAQATMFHIYIPAKHLKKYQICRILVQRPEDALHRMVLYAWVTDNLTDFMTERGVLEYCAASVIKKVWRGYAYRRNLSHKMAQKGDTLKIGYMDRMRAVQAERVAKMRQRKLKDPEYIIGNSERDSDPVEAIHELRQDYLPTAGVLEEYKSMQRRPVYVQRAATSIEEVSQSAKGLGLVTDVGEDWKELSSTLGSREFQFSMTLGAKDRQPLSALQPEVPNVLTENDEDPRAQSPFMTESPTSKERPKYSDTFKSFGTAWSSSTSSLESFERTRPLRKPAQTRTSIYALPEGPRRTSELSLTKQINQEQAERVRVAFSRLCCLHQLGCDVERSQIVDHSLEMKKSVSTKVRENLNETRHARKAAKEEAIAQTQARNRIEKEKFMEELSQRNRASSKLLTKNAKHIKHQIIMKHQKFERDRKMGLQVASVSRLISQKYDRQKRIETKMRELNKLQETAGAIKSKNMENRLAMREQLAEIEEQKRRLALIDRLLTENKRQIRDQHQAEFIQHLQETKRKDIERRKLAKSRQSLPIFPEPALSYVEDELQSASVQLSQYIGAHLGSVEARTIVDLINDVLLCS